MSESPHIHNVGMQNFQQVVLETSMQTPVLVDFWADWCQPCLQLAPILEKLANEYGGKFIVAKIDTEQEQELAAHFGIKSLPTMKLFYQGQLVDERVGLVQEGDLRAMLDKHIVSESEKYMQAAEMAYQQGHKQQAMDMLNHALANDPDNQQLKVKIALLVYQDGDKDSAVALLDSLDADGKKLDDAVRLQAQINMEEQLAGLPPLADIEAKLAEDPRDCEALIQKSRHLVAQAQYEAAMDCLLDVMRVDRSFEDDAGRKGLLEIFDMLGGDHPSVQKYRRKLFTLLH